MNGLDWCNLWDLVVIERKQRDEQLEQRRIMREANLAPGGLVARVFQVIGGLLVAAGQRLAGEPIRSRVEAVHAA
jgi:hypothetical protein